MLDDETRKFRLRHLSGSFTLLAPMHSQTSFVDKNLINLVDLGRRNLDCCLFSLSKYITQRRAWIGNIKYAKVGWKSRKIDTHTRRNVFYECDIYHFQIYLYAPEVPDFKTNHSDS